MDIKEYLDNLYTRLKEKKLENFWLVVDREDFKPLKGYSDAQFDKFLLKNKQYYANKKIANVTVYVVKSKDIKPNDRMLSIVIGIWSVTNNGELEPRGATLKVLYYENDLIKKKLTIKDIHKFVKLCADGILLTTHLNGLSFSKLMEKLKEKKIKF